jgi:branched-chain amino acid transport system permease protein
MVDILSLVISFASLYGVYAILAISLNLEYGYAGQPNFGQVLFYGLGAYVAAILAANLMPLLDKVPVGNICNDYAVLTSIGSNDPSIVIPVWILGLVVGMTVGGIVGLLLSYPALRVKEEWYLSMILLVAAEAFLIVIQNSQQIGCGIFGLNGIQNPFAWLSQTYKSSSFATSQLGIDLPGVVYAIVIIGFAGVCYVVAQKLANSPYGRLLKSIRDDKVASESLGKDVAKVRKQIMIVGSVMAGLAGGLFVFYSGVAVPDDYVATVTFIIWVMMILGGFANNRGVLVGAFVLTLLQRGTIEIGILVQNQLPSFNPTTVIYLEYVVEAVILIILLMFRPKGLIPEGRIKTKAYQLFDFSNKEASNLVRSKEEEEQNDESVVISLSTEKERVDTF